MRATAATMICVAASRTTARAQIRQALHVADNDDNNKADNLVVISRATLYRELRRVDSEL